jgi:hypothetical protein
VAARVLFVELKFFEGGLRSRSILPLRHCIGFLLLGDGGRAGAATGGGRQTAAARVTRGPARARARARAIIVEVMGSSFFAVMAAAIRLVGLLPGALVVVTRTAITFAASTIGTAVTIVAVSVVRCT